VKGCPLALAIAISKFFGSNVFTRMHYVKKYLLTINERELVNGAIAEATVGFDIVLLDGGSTLSIH